MQHATYVHPSLRSSTFNFPILRNEEHLFLIQQLFYPEMVRQKVRFILVHFQFEEGIHKTASSSTSKNNDEEPINASDIHKAMRECVSSSFGSIGIGATLETRVLYYDDQAQLALIKTSRDASNIIRATLTFLSIVKKILTCTTIISVHGCARTAKYHLIRETRKYHEYLIWNTLEPYFLESNFSGKEDVDSMDLEVTQCMKHKRRELRRKKKKMFDQLNERNEHRIKSVIDLIQKMD